jgi:uroporphyrinogen-III decarboxylase
MDDRIEQARQRIHDAYSHKDTGETPVLVMDVNYWVSGDAPQSIPDDYFTSSASMLAFQQAKIDRHLASIQDDYIPLLYPWYGTGVVPSAIGSKVLFQRGMDPAVEGPVLERPEDIRKLRRPNPLTDGLMPRVLETIRYFREHSSLPVMFTDAQGPLNIALTLCGVENFFVWAKEQPALAHELMDYTTEVLIDWIRVQKKHAGQSESSGAFPHSILLPEGFGGVCISDDDCTVISPKMYREFVVPYNSRVFKAFGGGTLHFCGSAVHQIENFLATEALTGINCFCMGDFKQIRRMQEKFDSRLTLMVCDFTPLNIESYYRELLANLRTKGTILATYPAAEFALEGGKYQIVSRDAAQLAEESARVIGGHLARPGQLVKQGSLA